jgi:tRNA A-37 threonylcarbamoyl transferase component Bud32
MTDLPLRADDDSFPDTVVGKQLLDLLKRLHRQNACGILFLTAEHQRASLCLDNGQLRAAFFNELSGTSALTRIIVIGQAQVRFESANAEKIARYPRTIQKDTALILSTVEIMLSQAASELPPAPEQHIASTTGALSRTQQSSPAASVRNNSDDDYLPPSTCSFTASHSAVSSQTAAQTATQAATATHSIDATTLRFATFLPPEPGALIGKCELLHEIGHGASSIVYRAKHRSLACDVVLKILLPATNDSNRLLTMNEARLLARLNHPNILRVFDFSDTGRWPHIITELVDGQSLAKLIKERRTLPTDVALPLMCQTAEALSYAHATMSVVHGDIKPDNILLSKELQVKLADFGLAKSHISLPELAQAFPAGVVAGSPSYIAPEQVQGGRDACDHRSDMYSLGATMYHAVTGRTPFSDPDPVQLMVKRLSEAPIPPHLVNPKVERRVSQLIMSMMARDPNNRIQTWDELLELMGDLIDSLTPSTDRYDGSNDTGTNVIRRRTSFWNYVPNRLFRRGSTGQHDVG